MKLAVDYFHPSYNGWEDFQGDLPEALLKALPTLKFGDGLSVREQSLSFYPDTKFIILKHTDWSPSNLFIYALVKGDETIWLNGTSPGIHHFNGAGHLNLTDDNIVEYVRFFCFFVRGKEGPFYVVSTIDAPYLTSELGAATRDGNEKLREIFKQRFQSPRYYGKSPEGDHRISALVMYSNALFIADFELKSTGMVKMANDIPVMADLPSKILAPLVPVQ